MSDQTGGMVSEYGRRVGERLRSIRRQMSLSLLDVEVTSDQEFKASVLGAYERGERMISVPRLQRLGRLYNVPVDQLLPPATDAEVGARANGHTDGAGSHPDGREAGSTGGVTFDLTRFAIVEDAQIDMVFRYLRSIMVQRQDFNGRVLTVRGDDIRAMAGLFGVEPAELTRRFDAEHLRVGSTAEMIAAS